MTPDETWRVLELFDYATAAIIEFGLVLGILVGVGELLLNYRLYLNAFRRTIRQWRKKNAEEK